MDVEYSRDSVATRHQVEVNSLGGGIAWHVHRIVTEKDGHHNVDVKVTGPRGRFPKFHLHHGARRIIHHRITAHAGDDLVRCALGEPHTRAGWWCAHYLPGGAVKRHGVASKVGSPRVFSPAEEDQPVR